MKISAVIPVWNGRDNLKALLDTIDRQTQAFNEIIVVDNGSIDGAADLAQQRGAKVIRFAQNLGFAAAVNRGVSEAGGSSVAVINSDVELLPDWLEFLSYAVQKPSVFFATGRILSRSDSDRIDGCWDLVSRAGMPWRAGHGASADSSPYRQSRIIDLASFTAVLFRRELWERVGPLDERFESYLEDVDFGLRCVSAGLSGFYESNAVCYHQGSATLGRWNRGTVRRTSRNQVFLARKYSSADWWTLFIGQGLWGFVALRHGRGIAWVQGKWEGWLRRKEFAPVALDLSAQERQILELQTRRGFDSYWRWYSLLTHAPARPIDTGADRE